MQTVLITKMNGEKEPFDQEKLKRSLQKAGATHEAQTEIVQHILNEITDGMSTREIYQHAFDMLKTKEKDSIAARYSIKRAVLELGPSGFPFEKFLAQIFSSMGYENVRTGVDLEGKCVPHEVDVVATHNGKLMGAEAKFHNSLGIKTDLKVALYVKARFDDLRDGPSNVQEGWLITNTRFTHNVIRFAKCAKFNLLGWNYPKGRGLEVLIDQAGMHPITALTTLNKEQKRILLDQNIVLCRNIDLSDEGLHSYTVARDQYDRVREEVRQLCNNQT